MSAASKRQPSARRAKKPAARGVINIRVGVEERGLIDQAAQLAGKSRSEFMLDAARRAAEDAILDRTVFHLSPEAFKKFQAILDAPPRPNEGLRRLMAGRAPWE